MEATNNFLLLDCCPGLDTLAFLFGLVFIASKLFGFLKILFEAKLRSEKDLLKRYGEGSYAVITGASDGIGKAFCFALAKRGFKIVLVARNKTKTEQVEKEIKQKYSSIKTKIVIADFSQVNNENFFKQIMEGVSGLDVSVLINNVGVGHGHYLTKMPEEQLKELVNVNCIPQVVLSRHFAEKFLERKNKSCIISISSFTASFPMPVLQTYGATKIFNDYFSRSISLEYPEIDILSVRPGYVDTAINKDVRKLILLIDTEDCVDAVLKDVGYETLTYGHWKHKLLFEILRLIPDWVRNLRNKSKPPRKNKSKKEE